MGSSCSGLFDDFRQDTVDEYALTEREKQELRKERKRKLSLLREGPVGFEVNDLLAAMSYHRMCHEIYHLSQIKIVKF